MWPERDHYNKKDLIHWVWHTYKQHYLGKLIKKSILISDMRKQNVLTKGFSATQHSSELEVIPRGRVAACEGSRLFSTEHSGMCESYGSR